MTRRDFKWFVVGVVAQEVFMYATYVIRMRREDVTLKEAIGKIWKEANDFVGMQDVQKSSKGEPEGGSVSSSPWTADVFGDTSKRNRGNG
jgi:hypothetical protein